MRFSRFEPGTASLHGLAVELRDWNAHRLRHEAVTPDEAARIFAEWYLSRRTDLAPYFNLTLMTLEFVDLSDRSNKVLYADILRATLSPGELFLLFHYGIGATSNNARLKMLAERYGVLEDFIPEMFDLPAERIRWYTVRKISREYGFT